MHCLLVNTLIFSNKLYKLQNITYHCLYFGDGTAFHTGIALSIFRLLSDILSGIARGIMKVIIVMREKINYYYYYKEQRLTQCDHTCFSNIISRLMALNPVNDLVTISLVYSVPE